jgi:hypothetical protein
MSDSVDQRLRAGDGSTNFQAGRDVITVHNHLGLSYADVKLFIAEERERIVQQVWERAQEMLRELGAGPGPVPMKSLFQLLQAASLEEEAYLQEQWAALLANTSMNAETASASPAYVEILRQLSSRHARFLDAIHAHISKVGSGGVRLHTNSQYSGMADLNGVTVQVMSKIYDESLGVTSAVSNASFHAAIDDLMRLGLMAVFPRPAHAPVRISFGGGPEEPFADDYGLTVLGINFILACRKPRTHEAE